jgi:hypothetical protein
MPGLALKRGVVARIGEGDMFLELWPSEPPEHLDDALTLTLTVDGGVVEVFRPLRRVRRCPRRRTAVRR